MNAEQLEELMIEHALGQLSPPASDLLEACLERDPALARQMSQLQETVHLTRQALPAPAIRPTIPPFPRQKVARAVASGRRVVWMRYAGSLAACIMLGLLIGRVSVAPEPAADPTPIVALPIAPTRQQVAAPSTPGFWSIRNFVRESDRHESLPLPDRKYRYRGPLRWPVPVDLDATKENES